MSMQLPPPTPTIRSGRKGARRPGAPVHVFAWKVGFYGVEQMALQTSVSQALVKLGKGVARREAGIGADQGLSIRDVQRPDRLRPLGPAPNRISRGSRNTENWSTSLIIALLVQFDRSSAGFFCVVILYNIVYDIVNPIETYFFAVRAVRHENYGVPHAAVGQG